MNTNQVISTNLEQCTGVGLVVQGLSSDQAEGSDEALHGVSVGGQVQQHVHVVQTGRGGVGLRKQREEKLHSKPQ